VNLPIEKKISILIVEDNDHDVLLLQNAIRQSGFKVEIEVATTIDEAIRTVEKTDYDCIYLDYYFPERNGADFLRFYSNSDKRGNIIMFTSQEDVHMAVECMKMGASDFLTKSQITPASVAKSLRYVTKLKEAREAAEKTEAALLESEFRLKSIIARSPILLFMIERDGTISMFKGKAASQLSIKPESVVGTNIREHENRLPVRAEDFEKACTDTESHFSTEVQGRHFDLNYIPIRNENKEITGMMGVAIDITSFKKNEEELMNTIEIKEAASKIKEQFLANMSHEIRTPIHGIISLTQFILSTSTSPEQREYLDLIRKSADTLLVIVNDILDLSKIDSGKMEFESVPFHLKDTIQTTLSAFIPKTIEKNIQLRTSFPDTLPEQLTGDPVRLIQILNNLLGNAIKFTEKGSVTVSAEITEKNKEFTVIQFEIADTGIGIPPHKLDSVFESFTQAGSDVTRKFGGTGLGLTITRQLVERQNGSIHVKSTLGEGSTFTFCLPFKNCCEDGQMEEKKAISAGQLMPGINILVAEDHDINRFIIEKMLKEWGAKVDFAITGTEAVQLAKENTYHLVLMDIEMPDMNGYTATEIIRTQLSSPANQVPIIAMTGHAMVGEKEKCISIGMNDYLSKPFKPEMLKEMIIAYTSPAANLSREMNKTNEGKKDTETNSLLKASINNAEKEVTTPVTNLGFLREISDNNEQFYIEFIELFLRNTPQSLQDMQEAITTMNWDKLRQSAHKAKPSFNYVGLKEMNLLAAKIEENAKQQKDMQANQDMLNQISQCCSKAFTELEQEIKTLNQNKTTEHENK
jgi:PAS domain S-box-containing protein